MLQATLKETKSVPGAATLSVGVVSVSLPPAVTGQAVVIERLFGQNKQLECVFFSEFLTPSHAGPNYVKLGSLLDVHVLSDAQKGKKEEFLKVYFKSLWTRAKLIAAEIRARKLDVMVASTGSPADIPATFLATLMTGKPFVVYLFDDATFQWTAPRFRKICGFFEWFWARMARAVICANLALARDYQERHGIKTEVLENPSSELTHPGKDSASTNFNSPARIVYTGSVYWAQADAMKNLLEAISGMDGAVEFHIYSEQANELKQEYDLNSPLIVCHPPVSEAEVLQLQAQADMLFLPLAFKSAITKTLMTAMPGKTGEYLASGTPVLVHAPAGSILCQYFQSKELGMVVDEPDPELLKAAIIKLRDDRQLRNSLVQNAKKEAENFQPDHLRQRLFTILGGK